MRSWRPICRSPYPSSKMTSRCAASASLDELFRICRMQHRRHYAQHRLQRLSFRFKQQPDTEKPHRRKCQVLLVCTELRYFISLTYMPKFVTRILMTVWVRGEAEPAKNCLEAASSRGRCLEDYITGLGFGLIISNNRFTHPFASGPVRAPGL